MEMTNVQVDQLETFVCIVACVVVILFLLLVQAWLYRKSHD